VTSLSGDDVRGESRDVIDGGERLAGRVREGSLSSVGSEVREGSEVKVGRGEIFKGGIDNVGRLDDVKVGRLVEVRIGRFELRDVVDVRVGKLAELRAGSLLAREVREALERDGRGERDAGRNDDSLTRGGKGPR